MDNYNGWSNRATWLVNVWFNPESIEDLNNAKEALEEAKNNCPDFLRDFIQDNVNWEELESCFEDEDEDEEEEEEEEEYEKDDEEDDDEE
jgi:hypothetical protein